MIDLKRFKKFYLRNPLSESPRLFFCESNNSNLFEITLSSKSYRECHTTKLGKQIDIFIKPLYRTTHINSIITHPKNLLPILDCNNYIFKT